MALVYIELESWRVAGSGLAAHQTGVENLRAAAGKSLLRALSETDVLQNTTRLKALAEYERAVARDRRVEEAPRPPCRI